MTAPNDEGECRVAWKGATGVALAGVLLSGQGSSGWFARPADAAASERIESGSAERSPRFRLMRLTPVRDTR